MNWKRCAPIKCQLYPAPPNSIVSPPGYAYYNQIVTLSCAPGFEASVFVVCWMFDIVRKTIPFYGIICIRSHPDHFLEYFTVFDVANTQEEGSAAPRCGADGSCLVLSVAPHSCCCDLFPSFSFFSTPIARSTQGVTRSTCVILKTVSSYYIQHGAGNILPSPSGASRQNVRQMYASVSQAKMISTTNFSCHTPNI